MEPFNFWNSFFHDRVSDDACRLGGFLRIGFGLVFLVDRLVLGLDLDDFFSPSHGFLPMEVGRNSPFIDGSMWSLLELYPKSDRFLWILFWIGIMQGCLLVLGVFPRLQLACLLLNIISFQNHNFLFWNEQDALFRIWCYFLFFLPLHRITVFDLFPNNRNSNTNTRDAAGKEETWPVWPFRLFQIQLAIMYMGLSLNKIENEAWRSGDALLRIRDLHYFSGGWFKMPEIIFNSMLGLHLLNWLTLALELTCWVTMWIPMLKKQTAICMIMFNLVVDLTMNFHCLPWLVILGWCATLFEIKGQSLFSTRQAQGATTPPASKAFEVSLLVNAALAASLALLCIDALPIQSIERLLIGETSALSHLQGTLYESIEPTLCLFGFWQATWNLYGGPVNHDYHALSFSAVLYVDDGRVGEPEIQTDVWESPRFDEMTGLQRKRHGRQLIYWSNLDNKHEGNAWLSLVEQLAERSNRMHREAGTGTVVGVELQAYWQEYGDQIAPRWSWTTPAKDRDNAVYSWTSVLKTRFCTNVMPIGWSDSSPESPSSVDKFCYDCVSQSNFVERYCRAQCEVCVDHHSEFGLEYLSYPMSEYAEEECTDEDNWDEEACPFFVYYRDLDPGMPLEIAPVDLPDLTGDADPVASSELILEPTVHGTLVQPIVLLNMVERNQTIPFVSKAQQQQTILKSE